MGTPRIQVLVFVDGSPTMERCINFRYISNSIQPYFLSIPSPTSLLSIPRFIFSILNGWIFSTSRKWNLVISIGTWTGLVFSLLQKISIKKALPHIVVESSSLPLLASYTGFVPKLETMFVKFSFSGATKIICFASAQRDFWNQHLGFKEKAIFLPLGEPVNRISKSDSSGDYIFSGGRTGRDFLTLILAAKKLNQKLVICGTCNEKIRKMATKNIKIIDEIPFPEYLQLLKNSKFVVLTLENVPYSTGLSTLLTSMASCRAVIVTKTSGIMDYINDYETGIFVNPFDVNDLKEKILYLIKNPSEIERIGNNAMQTVKTYFSEPIMDRKITNIILDVAKRDSRGAHS